MAFTDGVNSEHMWLVPVTFDGTNFQGTVKNEPEKMKTVKLGQKVTVSPAKISDWMYLEGRKLVGGQTLRVLRDAMTPEERADFDKSVPFVVELQSHTIQTLHNRKFFVGNSVAVMGSSHDFAGVQEIRDFEEKFRHWSRDGSAGLAGFIATGSELRGGHPKLLRE